MKRWNVRDPEYNHSKVWGGERWLVNHEEYCGKLLFLNNNSQCSFHHHKKKHETFIILRGRVYMKLDELEFIMEPGDAVEVPRGVDHSFTGLMDSIILEVSTQHFEDDSYRTTTSKKLNWKERKLLRKVVKNLMEKDK